MSDRHMFFFLIYRIGDWSLNNRFISRDFFNNLIRVDRLSRKQRFEKKACLDNIHHSSTTEYFGWAYQHIRKQKSMLQVQYYEFSLKYFPTGSKNRLI